MILWFVESPIAPILLLVIKATVLVALATLLQLVLMRRMSAAARHLVWIGALTGLLLMPLVSGILPGWPVPIRVESEAAAVVSPPPIATPVPQPAASEAGAPLLTSGAPVAANSTTVSDVVWMYFAGVIALVMYWIVQQFRMRQFIRRAIPVDDSGWTVLFSECARVVGVTRPVRLLKTRERTVPLAFGTRRPAIVMPAIAESWDDDRRRAVLLHELAHVARHDCLTETFALAVCALYWFHPAVWWVAQRVRVERELACDDRAIAAGTEPRDYAGHLVEIAYSCGGRRAPALAVCMARPRQLEGRVLAALDSQRSRRIPSRRARVVFTAIAIVLLGSISSATLTVDAASPLPVSPAAESDWPVARDTARVAAPADTSSREETLTRLRARHLKSWWEVKPLSGVKTWLDRPAVRAAVASMTAIAQDAGPGTWEIRPTDTTGVVHLRLIELNSSSGNNVPLEQLEGVNAAQLTGPGGQVQFRMRRDAGTFTFEGVIRSGVGAGTFTFTPDANFPAEMVKRGFARPTAGEQYQLARHDVGFAFIDELSKQGYAKPPTSELVRAGQHGVQATYLREMGTLGYRLGALDSLITLRDHGVTPDYVRQLQDAGYKGLSADKVREARDHGITPEYVRTIRDAGYNAIPIDDLIKVRDHGVTPEYVRALGDAGYRKLPLDEVVRVRDHGVSAEYVREIRQLGYSLSIDDLVRARDHGVTLEYVREMQSLGYGGQPIDSLIRTRDHGVTAEYAKDVKALGYDKLTLDDLVTLRDQGLTAERIRSANSRAGTRLPIDMLKSLAAGGMR